MVERIILDDEGTSLCILMNKTYSDKRITFDDEGVPIVNYGYVDGVLIGKQQNPVFVCNIADKYYKDYADNRSNKSRMLFLNCARWLVNNARSYGSYKILEYHFPWPKYNIKPPWRSGMAQALAIQVLIKAHKLTNDDIYIDASRDLLNSFFVEVKDGGVTYKDEEGWWYEEFASDDCIRSMVLNGMMFALLGIYDYYKYTSDNNAKYLFDKGVLSLKNNISKYDYKGYSYYDILGNPPIKYHEIHVR
ncbi:MAG: hypothetical protein D6752_02240, partial [Candidatus Nitrosothermus koennekii]